MTRPSRREFLRRAGGTLAGLPLAANAAASATASSLLGQDGFESPMAMRTGHLPGKAKSVIFLFMYGGPSQVDTFDYKPKLYPLDGKTIEIKTRGRGGSKNQGRVVGPKWSFKPYGQCGHMVSELFPHLGSQVDRMAFVH